MPALPIRLAALVLLFVAVGGCGQDGASASAPPPGAPTPAAPPGASAAATGDAPQSAAAIIHAPDDPAKIAGLKANVKHIIVIYQENWSFDGLYGKFPGANGLANAGKAVIQVDLAGHPYTQMPTCYFVDDDKKTISVDPRIPRGLPMAPFDLKGIYKPDEVTGDLVHRFYQEQWQIDGGKMDRYACYSDAGGFTMSYYDGSQMPEGKLATQYTLCDNYFHAAFGGSFLNHMWLIAARTPYWGDAPAKYRSEVYNGTLVRDAQLTPDGYAVNTIYSVYKPWVKGKPGPLPPLTFPTIGDRLDDAKVDWAWYSGGFDNAMAGHPDEEFQFHHQPFTYFKNFGDENAPGHRHLQDETQFEAGLKTGNIPPVCFVKPLGDYNEHPGYARLQAGQEHAAELVQAIMDSPVWKDSIVIITYDENGGRWDHVPPPKVDAWGPGTRVPLLVISPFAKKHFIDSTEYDTTSILRLIESRWDLPPLTTRDQNVNNMLNALDFNP
ncbi:MAG: alkaline phosphatase family protein [Planctomycetota bacterium]